MRNKNWQILFVAWTIALVATLGSLFFSQVMLLPPCTLCWYQRICMYPLVIMLLTALVKDDLAVIRYTFPLSFIGWLTALYHNLLYYHLIPESASPCVQGISCTSVQLNWLGFITIPLLSLTAFTIVCVLLFVLKVRTYETT